MAAQAQQKKPPNRTCLLMSAGSNLLARGEIESPPDAHNIQVRVTEGDPGVVVDAGRVNVVPLEENEPTRQGQVILRRGKLLVLEPMKSVLVDGEDLRRNLRMPVYFESLIYFESGGRALIRADNLSCGGIAFYSTAELSLHERFEIVIPITSEAPSILTAEVLRCKPYVAQVKFYAAQFVELLREEEARVREAVFHVQLRRGRQVTVGGKR